MTPTTWRRPASIAAAVLITSALPLLAVSAPAHADTTIEKSIDYTCATYAELEPGLGIDLGDLPTGVAVRFTVPTLYRGASVPATSVDVNLTLPQDLHGLVVKGVRAVSASGSSEDAKLDVRAGDAIKSYPISGLSVTDQPIEQDVEKLWTVAITGSSPVIPVPDAASVDLLAPAAFTVKAKLRSKNDGEPDSFVDASLSCKPTGDRLIATVPVLSAPKVMPVMTAQVRDKVVRANSTRPQLLVRTNAKPQATGTVDVYTEDRRKIATGSLNANGDVRIVLPRFGKRGNRVLVVDYTGDRTTSAKSVTARFRVS